MVSLSERHIEFNEFDFQGFEGNNKVGFGDLKESYFMTILEILHLL